MLSALYLPQSRVFMPNLHETLQRCGRQSVEWKLCRHASVFIDEAVEVGLRPNMEDESTTKYIVFLVLLFTRSPGTFEDKSKAALERCLQRPRVKSRKGLQLRLQEALNTMRCST